MAKGLLLIAGPKKGAADDSDDMKDAEASEESEDMGAFEEAADDLMAAMKDGDKEMFRLALKSAIKACNDEYSEE